MHLPVLLAPSCRLSLMLWEHGGSRNAQGSQGGPLFLQLRQLPAYGTVCQQSKGQLRRHGGLPSVEWICHCAPPPPQPSAAGRLGTQLLFCFESRQFTPLSIRGLVYEDSLFTVPSSPIFSGFKISVVG